MALNWSLPIRIATVLLIMKGSVILGQDYLIVVHDALYDTTWHTPLVRLKSIQGYSVDKLVIHNGYRTHEIRDSITVLNPDYVLLVGDANEAPESEREVTNSANGNFIPFHYELMDDLIHGPDTPIATDDYYVASCTHARIGRIPAETTQEINTWVAKLTSQSRVTQFEPWRNQVLFITGNRDHPSNGCVGRFRDEERDSLIVKYVQANGFSIDTLNSKSIGGSGYWPATLERAEAFETSMNEGRAIVNALGTGSEWSFLVNFYWTGREPVSPEPTWNFTNNGMYPFLIGVVASTGYVQKSINDEEFDTVMERLLFLPNAGIIGAVAPTWITITLGTALFSDIFYDQIFSHSYFDIGSVLDTTKKRFESLEPRLDWQSRATLIFGDPSMALPLFQKVAGELISDTKWQGAILIENDVIIKSNVTLEILPGTGIFFKPGKKLIVEGHLIEKGTIDYPITYAAADSLLALEDTTGTELLPKGFTVLSNYPNPFNPATTIRYELPRASEVSLMVYDVLGREITRIVEATQSPGTYTIRWDGTDALGRAQPSGIYIARLVTPEYTKSIKMLLLK